MTRGQVSKLVEKGRLSAEQGEAQVAETLGRIQPHHLLRGLRRRGLRDRGRARADDDQAGRLRRARRLHPRPRDPRLQHLLAVDQRDRRRHPAPGKGGRLPLLLPGLGDAPGRDRGRRGDLRRDRGRRDHLRPDDPQAADHLRGGARLRGQPGAELRRVGDLARAGGEGPLDQADRRGRGRRQGHADGAVLPRQPARAGHRPARRRAPRRVLRRGTLLRPQGHAEAGRRRETGRQDRRGRLLRPAGPAESPRRERARRGGARRDAVAEDLPRGVPGARGGRRHPPRHRLRDDGRRRAGPPSRAAAAVHEGRQRRPRHACWSGWRTPASATASASRHPRSCAASWPRGGSARRAARASTPTPGPTPSSRPRPSSSRRARTASRSPGWPTAR